MSELNSHDGVRVDVKFVDDDNVVTLATLREVVQVFNSPVTNSGISAQAILGALRQAGAISVVFTFGAAFAGSTQDGEPFGRFISFKVASLEIALNAVAFLRQTEVKKIIEDVGIGVPLVPAWPSDKLLGSGDVATAIGGGLETQWYLFRCAVPEIWDSALETTVVIAAIDWGFRLSHRDIEANVAAHYSVDGVSFDEPPLIHGTGTLGQMIAPANNVGIVGVAPTAKAWAIRAGIESDPPANPDWEPWAEAVRWAAAKSRPPTTPLVIVVEAQTITGGNILQIMPIRYAVRWAIVKKGIAVVVPAGNGSRRSEVDDFGYEFPDAEAIVVGATAYDSATNVQWIGSNYGDRVTTWAPGDPQHDVTCSDESDTAYRKRFGGTSGAAAKVAGVVALMLQAEPKLRPEEIRLILEDSSESTYDDDGNRIGAFMNASDAVQQLGVR